jgi:hypothetical protein
VVLLYFTTADLPVICPLGSFGAEVHFRIWGAGRGGEGVRTVRIGTCRSMCILSCVA